MGFTKKKKLQGFQSELDVVKIPKIDPKNLKFKKYCQVSILSKNPNSNIYDNPITIFQTYIAINECTNSNIMHLWARKKII